VKWVRGTSNTVIIDTLEFEVEVMEPNLFPGAFGQLISSSIIANGLRILI